MNLTAGKCVSQAIAVAAELGIADLLKDGPRTAADIARTANASKTVSIGCSRRHGERWALRRDRKPEIPAHSTRQATPHRLAPSARRYAAIHRPRQHVAPVGRASA